MGGESEGLHAVNDGLSEVLGNGGRVAGGGLGGRLASSRCQVNVSSMFARNAFSGIIVSPSSSSPA